MSVNRTVLLFLALLTAATAVLTVTSPVFEEGQTIPKVHWCTSDGSDDPNQKNESTPLSWFCGTFETKSYALIMRDLDNHDLLHWVIYDIPPTTTALPQKVQSAYEPAEPMGARQVYYNGSASLWGYQGPCSPASVNTYEFTVHALDREELKELNEESSVEDAARVVERASLSSGRLTGES